MPYYLNAPTLSEATSVFTNANLSTCAPNGYYSEGSIVRQQIGCLLLPQEICPQCGTPCGGSIAGSGNQGLYQINLNAGSLSTNVGAIIIKFNPQNIPDGIKAIYNGSTYNKLSSPNFGYIAGTDASGPTYTGSTSGIGACTILTSGGSVTLTNYLYNGTSFSNLGTTQPVTVTTGQVSTRASSVGNCVMVVPKPTATPNLVNIYVYGVCSTGTVFDISVSCPALLPSFTSTVLQTTEPSSAICSLPLSQTFYFAKVHTATDTYVGLYDWVFSDPYGQNVLPDGWYRINNLASPNDTIRVENGVVTTLYDKCA
jgi:hypothetical protein